MNNQKEKYATDIFYFLWLPVNLQVLAQGDFQTKSISIFKNGFAFFVKEGNITPTNYTFTTATSNLPQASFGTFWVASDELNYIRTLTKNIEETKETKVTHIASNITSILQTNVNKQVNLHTKEAVISGNIKRLNGQIVVLEKDGKWLNIPLELIEWLSFEEQPSFIDSTFVKTFTQKSKASFFEFNFKSNTPRQKVDMVYLQNGLGWFPQYKVDLLSDDKAKLSLQATVLNDAEDIKNATINFVVGYPNFKYANIPYAFDQQQITNFSGLLNKLGGKNNSNYVQFSDRANRGNSTYGNRDINNTMQGTASSTNIIGESEEDLYFYPIKNVTLPKGSKAFYQVFNVDIPIEHIYEVRLGNNDTYRNHQSEFSFSPNYKNKVWHTLKLFNKTNNPWTNGSVTVVNSDDGNIKPISQDDLVYTPIGGSTSLKLTIAPNVSVIDSEKETSREVRLQQDDTYFYDIVTVEGAIKLKNYKSDAIHLNVRKKINGVLNVSNPEWSANTIVNPSLRYNKINEVCWELDLKGGESKVVKYQYKIFVKR